MKIKYSGSVLTPAGFRGVEFEATAEKISEKRAKVIEVLTIDGEDVISNMSRTGSFYGVGAASREEGKTKNLSSCKILECR
jgi:hypothetical protein